jgi:hypothetical protein
MTVAPKALQAAYLERPGGQCSDLLGVKREPANGWPSDVDRQLQQQAFDLHIS